MMSLHSRTHRRDVFVKVKVNCCLLHFSKTTRNYRLFTNAIFTKTRNTFRIFPSACYIKKLKFLSSKSSEYISFLCWRTLSVLNRRKNAITLLCSLSLHHQHFCDMYVYRSTAIRKHGRFECFTNSILVIDVMLKPLGDGNSSLPCRSGLPST